MAKYKDMDGKAVRDDLRDGLRGHLTVREAPLAGADPLHSLDDPHPAAPGFTAPAGQATHS